MWHGRVEVELVGQSREQVRGAMNDLVKTLDGVLVPHISKQFSLFASSTAVKPIKEAYRG